MSETLSISILQEADGLINGHRRQDYGGPLESFSRIAALWNAYLDNLPGDRDLLPEDAALMLGLLKVSRATQGFHRDSLVDLAGYAGCCELIQKARDEQPKENQ